MAAEIKDLLQSEGATSLSDVIGIWPTPEELQHELDGKAQQCPDLLRSAAEFYARAKRLATRESAEHAQAIVAVRESGYARRATRIAPYLQVPPTKQMQHKAKLMWRQSQQEVRPQAAVGSNVALPSIGDAETGKLDALFQILAAHVLDLSQLGLDKPEERSSHTRDLVMQGASRASAAYIAAATSGLRRWLRFAELRGACVVSPAPAEMAAFLREVGQGGPTASASVYQSLS